MAAVDYITGYITDQVDGFVRPYVAQGAAMVGDFAGGIMYSLYHYVLHVLKNAMQVGDKISSTGRGVGETINGYSAGVGNSGAPQANVPKALPSTAPTAGNPLGLSGQDKKPQKAIEGPKKSATSTAPKALPSTAPSTVAKPSVPSTQSRPPMPTTAAGRKAELERLKAKGIQRAAAGRTGSKPKPPAPESVVPGDSVSEAGRPSKRTAKKGRRGERP
ncbi:MAG: hypothetical protein Q9191_005542 [Dirinaria sp. TL-2023a]